ncbi:MAG: L-rhamnose mutarotase [Bacteroidetes bacterium RBG_13_43_22]|jgi:L-rhamnose mutarotase|nr:MAG: L-rhamnose mutarotase [Bacteroidetes bacterium RBG_13_43_22]
MNSIRIKRYCKTLSLHPDPEIIRQYKAVHAKGAAWPEITQGMKEVGILDMEIYINDNQLFMIMELPLDLDHDAVMAELVNKPRQAEWEAYVSKFQKTSSDTSANEKWKVMERIYKLGK